MVRVNPPSVRQYAQTAQQEFDTIRAELQGLVEDSVRVQYFGPNAVAFKTRCGQLASDLSRTLGSDLARMADSVRQSTTNIVQALGGHPVVISVNPAAVVPPSIPPGDDTVELDPTALENLKPDVTRRIARITTGLDNHLAGLQRTDWTGNAKERLMGEVRGTTTTAKSHVTNAERVILQHIDKQVDDIRRGDQ